MRSSGVRKHPIFELAIRAGFVPLAAIASPERVPEGRSDGLQRSCGLSRRTAKRGTHS